MGLSIFTLHTTHFFFTHFLFYVNKFMYFCIDSHIIINNYGKKLEEDRGLRL